MAKNEAKQFANLKIGDLARLSGISTHTLRIWERRYGSPQVLRTHSGHRRYQWAEVARLRAVAVALKNGYRPNQVAGASLVELRVMIKDKVQHLSLSGKELEILRPSAEDLVILESWIDALHQFHEGELQQSFQAEWARKGMMSFIQCLAIPFIKRLGDGWERGEITVAEEHFAAEKLSYFLNQIWRHQNELNNGTSAVLATPTDEDHGLGLVMAAVVLSFAGFRIIYLGVNTPWEDITEVTFQCQSPLVVMSLSSQYPRSKAQKYLSKLHQGLPQETVLVAGGGGSPGNIEGVITIQNFKSLFEYGLNYLKDGKNK